jgi:hypothetical protein
MGKLLSFKIKSEQRLALLLNMWRRFSTLPISHSFVDELHASSLLIKGAVASSKAIIAGNGPSFNLLQDSIPNLRNVDIIASNFAYKSSFYPCLSPKLHFIIDPKIASGIWSPDMIREILDLTPSTVVVLDVRWKSMAEFKRFRHNPRIAWILPVYIPSYYSNPRSLDFSTGFHGLNVTACAFSMAVTLGYMQLAFIGVEADGLFREIIDQPSHFYDEPLKDQALDGYDLMIDSLHLSSYSLCAWSGFVKSVEAQGVEIFNLSDQGIFDVCRRRGIDKFTTLDL